MSQVSIWKLITVLGATVATLTAEHADGAADAPLYSRSDGAFELDNYLHGPYLGVTFNFQ